MKLKIQFFYCNLSSTLMLQIIDSKKTEAKYNLYPWNTLIIDYNIK